LLDFLIVFVEEQDLGLDLLVGHDVLDDNDAVAFVAEPGAWAVDADGMIILAFDYIGVVARAIVKVVNRDDVAGCEA